MEGLLSKRETHAVSRYTAIYGILSENLQPSYAEMLQLPFIPIAPSSSSIYIQTTTPSKFLHTRSSTNWYNMSGHGGISQTDPYSHFQSISSNAAYEAMTADKNLSQNRPRTTAPPFQSNYLLANTYNVDRGMKGASQSNVDDRFELFLLGEGEKKVTEAADTRE
jgi:hypothetical protein